MADGVLSGAFTLMDMASMDMVSMDTVSMDMVSMDMVLTDMASFALPVIGVLQGRYSIV